MYVVVHFTSFRCTGFCCITRSGNGFWNLLYSKVRTLLFRSVFWHVLYQFSNYLMETQLWICRGTFDMIAQSFQMRLERSLELCLKFWFEILLFRPTALLVFSLLALDSLYRYSSMIGVVLLFLYVFRWFWGILRLADLNGFCGIWRPILSFVDLLIF